MVRVLLRWSFALVAATLWVLATASDGKAQHSAPQLVPGSADVIHDVSGIAIGMSCQEALAKGKEISPQSGKYVNARGYGGRYVASLDGIRVEYDIKKFDIPLRLIESTSFDTLTFDCIVDGGKSEVVRIYRHMRFPVGNEQPPAIASVRAIFQEKFGVPTVEFSPFAFATLFNRKGPIQTNDKLCVEYTNNHLYNENFREFDSNKCTYALTFVANQGRIPGSVESIQILIIDHLRLENAVRAMEKRKLETTPTAAPKL